MRRWFRRVLSRCSAEARPGVRPISPIAANYPCPRLSSLDSLASAAMHLKLISLLGLVVFIAVAWAISSNRKLFPWRTVLWGLALQIIFAILILKTPWGAAIFDFTGRAINKMIQFSNEGCQFVFGPLAVDSMMQAAFPQRPFVFAVLVVGTIIIVASLSSLFYHWGVLQK